MMFHQRGGAGVVEKENKIPWAATTPTSPTLLREALMRFEYVQTQ